MAAEVMAFTGKTKKVIDRDWAKGIAPRGSKLIAWIDVPDELGGDNPYQHVLFRSVKGSKLTMYYQIPGMKRPRTVNEPHANLKLLFERKPLPTITSFITMDELNGLMSIRAIEKEKEEKKKEISRIPNKLSSIRDTLDEMEKWQKVEAITDPEERESALYYLAAISSSCSTMAVNVLANMSREPSAEEEA
jgi:hypothetical protein